MGVTQLKSERICIRRLDTDDLSSFLSYRSNPQVTKYQGFDVMNKEQARSFIEQNLTKDHTKDEWQQLAIVLNDTNQLIGDCALKVSQGKYKVANVGITIHADYQKKGFATEVFSTLLKYLFEELSTQKVIEIVLKENQASIALLHKIGFTFDSELSSDDNQNTELQYSLLSRNWKKLEF